MSASKPLRALALAAVVAAALGSTAAAAQTVGPRITVGSNPRALAVNPVTGKIYVANAGTTPGADTVTVINGTTFGTASISVGEFPAWVAINVETNRIYVSNLTSATTSVINGATDTVLINTPSGGGGWTAINPLNDTAYVIRYGSADEFNTIIGTHYELTSASHSFEPVAIAVNPVNNRLYLANKTTGDISANDVTTPTPYPPLLCPNGSGGFKPDPVPPVASPGTPCIDVANTPVSVAINPVTNTVYALSNSGASSISVINGSTHTHTALTPTGSPTGGKVIAVNPITNKVYALYNSSVVVVDAAAGNAMTVIPSPGGPAAIGINVLTNTAYVANADGTLLVIAGNNTTSTLALTTGSNAIAVDPAANKVYVLDTGGGVTVVNGATGTPTATGITTTITPLAGNTGGASGTLSLAAASTMAPAPLNQVRRVYYRIDNGPWQPATGSGPFVAAYSGLANGSHTITAFATNSLESPNINTDLASVPIVGNLSSYTFTVSTASPAASITPTAIDFGGQSMGTTSPPSTVTVTNSGTGTLTINGIAVSNSQFSQTNNCTSLTAGASCTITVTFNPAVAAGPLNTEVDVDGTLTISHSGLGSPSLASLEGVAEKSLVSHYYRSILRRAPDAGAVDYWQGEAARLALLGANVNEAWFALAMAFFTSPEYQSFNRNDTAYVTDLYKTFFNREPDGAGLAYWNGQLSQGMPRELVLLSFMFSSEFRSFTTAIFGDTAARAEVDVAGDFYRGLLARLGDTAGFNFWVGQFRAAQCASNPGNAVNAQVESISAGFSTSPEYDARGRTNADFVADMYNAFLRRGGDIAGVQFWINQLDTGAQTRQQVRQSFIGTPEFQARVQAIIAAGCVN
jgi:DNA-binding beta-propeller fold protein YncE